MAPVSPLTHWLGATYGKHGFGVNGSQSPGAGVTGLFPWLTPNATTYTSKETPHIQRIEMLCHTILSLSLRRPIWGSYSKKKKKMHKSQWNQTPVTMDLDGINGPATELWEKSRQ